MVSLSDAVASELPRYRREHVMRRILVVVGHELAED